jgi:hypothetical protein
VSLSYGEVIYCVSFRAVGTGRNNITVAVCVILLMSKSTDNGVRLFLLVVRPRR